MSIQVAVVTGGSSGLGYEIAANLVGQGQAVCLVGRTLEALKTAQTNISKLASRTEVLSYPCNVADESGVSALFKWLADKGKDVSHVFNVAGIGKYGPPETTSRNMVDVVFESNLVGLIVVSTFALRAMKEKGGTIVNVMSTASVKANPQETVYCAAKWGARGYTESLRAALKGSKIHVVAVYPGGMNTPFWKADSSMSPDTSKFMNPAEVADVICDAIRDRKTLYSADLTIERK
ncbi:MAG: SDR family oxidoreductase [Coriobacteriia bacterium]|nr:SDR family oxidoreductase [Coriobacteriia bacterium]